MSNDATRRANAVNEMSDDARAQAFRRLCGEIYVSQSAVTQQARRLRENAQTASDYMADGRLLILAAQDTYRAARGCLDLVDPSDRPLVEQALGDFDSALPQLQDARDVLQHSDEYLIGAGRKQVAGLTYNQFYARDGSTHRVVIGSLTIDVDCTENETVKLATAVIVNTNMRARARGVRASLRLL